MGKVDFKITIRPLNRYFSECGDTGRVYKNNEICCLALVDVLGHGAVARSVAILAENYLDSHYGDDPVSLLQGLHAYLSGTRGAVAAFCRLCLQTGELDFAGIGNITAKIIGEKNESLVSRDGIIGYRAVRPHAVKTRIKPGDVVLMHSDGIKSHIDLSKTQTYGPEAQKKSRVQF